MVSLPTRIEVVNVVATAALDHPIDLESLYELFLMKSYTTKRSMVVAQPTSSQGT